LWFALAGFGIIGLIAVASAAWVTQFMTHALLEREAEVSQELFQNKADSEDSALFRHDAHNQPPNRPLLEFARQVANTPGIMRGNIYSTDGHILWSTEDQLIGRVFPDNQALERALQGKLVFEINSLKNYKAKYVAFGESGLFIQTYMPIRSIGGDRPVIGIVELYKYPTTLNATIDAGRRVIWLSALGAAVLLYLTLYWIVQRGAVLIEGQQEQLSNLQSFAVIGELASAVAHSLRNPMATIRSSVELCRSEIPAASPCAAHHVIHEIDRMDEYIRDLLAYAQPEQSRTRLLDPTMAINGVMAKRDAALRRNSIVVRQLDQRPQPSEVLVDPILFEHALTGIVTNAIEAMPDGGTLDVTVSADTSERNVIIKMTDSGPHVPDELVNRTTDRYFTTKSKGLGLGLALARGVIERWAGTLDITGIKNVGTTVTISLKKA
jgi:two-component system sensor histidine kinase HydH